MRAVPAAALSVCAFFASEATGVVLPTNPHVPGERPSFGQASEEDEGDMNLDMDSVWAYAEALGINITHALGPGLWDAAVAEAAAKASDGDDQADAGSAADTDDEKNSADSQETQEATLQELIKKSEPKGLVYTLELSEMEAGASFNADVPKGCKKFRNDKPFFMKCIFKIGLPFKFEIKQELTPAAGIDPGSTRTESVQTAIANPMFQSFAPPPFNAKCPTCGVGCNVHVGQKAEHRKPIVETCSAVAKVKNVFSEKSIPDVRTLLMAPQMQITQKNLIAHGNGKVIGNFNVAWQVQPMKLILGSLGGKRVRPSRR